MALSLVIIGIGLIATCLILFWDRIKAWLMDNVANFLESRFGLALAQSWKKSIVYVDRIIKNGKQVVRKLSKSFIRQGGQERIINVIEYDSEADYTLEELEEMDSAGQLCQTFVIGDAR